MFFVRAQARKHEAPGCVLRSDLGSLNTKERDPRALNCGRDTEQLPQPYLTSVENARYRLPIPWESSQNTKDQKCP